MNAEQYINKFSDKLRDTIYQSYEADYLMSQEFYNSEMTLNDILNDSYLPKNSGPNISIKKTIVPIKQTLKEIINIIPVHRRQFRHITHNGIASYIPAISRNIEIIDYEMNVHGYVRTVLEPITDKYNKPWFFLIYKQDPNLTLTTRRPAS